MYPCLILPLFKNKPLARQTVLDSALNNCPSVFYCLILPLLWKTAPLPLLDWVCLILLKKTAPLPTLVFSLCFKNLASLPWLACVCLIQFKKLPLCLFYPGSVYLCFIKLAPLSYQLTFPLCFRLTNSVFALKSYTSTFASLHLFDSAAPPPIF